MRVRINGVIYNNLSNVINPFMYYRTTLLSIFLLSTFHFQCYGQTQSTEDIDSLFRKAHEIILRYPDSGFQIGESIFLLSEELNYEWGLLQSRLINGIYQFQKNELDSAAEILLEVINSAQELKQESFEEARARNIMGMIFTRLNSFDKALINFAKAEEIFESLDEQVYYAMALNNRGTIYGYRGDYPEALEVFLKGRDLALSGKLPERWSKGRLSTALSNISQVYSEMDEGELALDYAKQALQIDLELDNPIAIGDSYLIIGTVFYSMGQLDSAYQYYVRCATTAPVEEYPRLVPKVLEAKQNMANILAEQGKQNEAIQLIRESIELRSKNERFQIELSYNLLAENYRSIGRLDSTIYYAKKALEVALINDRKTNAHSSAQILDNIYRQLGNYDSAYVYKSLYHELKDSIFNQSNERKFSNLRIELETAEKEQEIAQLHNQRAIIERDQLILRTIAFSMLILAILIITLLIYRYKNNQKRQQINQLELQNMLDMHESRLQQQTLHMIHLNHAIGEVEENLKLIKKKTNISSNDIQKLLSSITINKSMEKEWDQFETYFSQIHSDFHSNFEKQHNNLTKQERRLISLIKLDLNPREISSLLKIEQRSVIMNRYRLKRKLGLAEKEDLESYIRKF